MKKMDNVLKLVEYWIFNQTGGEEVIKAIKILNENIPLSALLGVSHVFCENKSCGLYTPCADIEDWVNLNPELYDAEILCFADLLEECGDRIDIDITDSSDAKLQQLYKLILSV